MTAATRATASVLAGLAALIAGTVLDGTVGHWEQNAYSLLSTWAVAVICGLCGIRVVQCVPRNAVGWVMVALSTATGVTFLLQLVSYAGLVVHAAPRWVGVVGFAIGSGWWLLWFAALGYLVMLFPDGQPVWPRLPWVTGVLVVEAYVTAAMSPGPIGNEYGNLQNPLGAGFFDGVGAVLVIVGMVGLLACLVAAAVSAVVRFRRADGVERQQMKWLASVGVAVPVALAACFAGDLVLHADTLGELVLPVVGTVVPIAMATAILRFRLYDVDHFVSRAVTWSILSAAVIVVFAASAVVVGVIAGGHSPWATATATAAALAVAWRLRLPVQTVVDMHFDRATSTALATVDGFLAGVRDGRRDITDVERMLRDALHDRDLSVAFWLPQTAQYVDAAGAPVDGAGSLVVGEATNPVARIERAAEPPDNSHAVRMIVSRSRLALELARARAEVAASRARIVEAGYEERRRIERDLHDGAQQRLVALGVTVRRLQRSLPPEARILGPALDQVVDDIADAVGDLRRLAAGLRPARLDDGLAPALADLVRTSPVAVDIQVIGRRPPATIETAAYFVACEGVTNAVKHSGAGRIAVTAEHCGQVFRVRVRDDGAGGARLGSGLAGLRDRVAAHGGHLTLESAAGAGTMLQADLPCE